MLSLSEVPDTSIEAMKSLLRILLPILVATSILGSTVKAGNVDGSVDVGRFVPEEIEGGRITIELKGALLNIASRIAAHHEPEAGALLAGLREIRVNVIDLNKNKAEEITQRFQSGRKHLEGSGWTRVVSVLENGDDVAIHAKTRGEDSVEGLCISILGADKQAVFVNLVGDLRPEQLAKLGGKLDLPGIQKAADALEKKK